MINFQARSAARNKGKVLQAPHTSPPCLACCPFKYHQPSVVECRSAYHAAHTEKCLQCSEPVAPEKGKFSGEYYDFEDQGRVHSECYEAYADATADKCIVCKEGVRKKGRFCGEYAVFQAGKVHKVRFCEVFTWE